MTSPRGYDAGTAFLNVIPSFRGVQRAIENEVKGIEKALGRKSGEEFGKNFEEGTNKAVDRVLGTETAKKAARKAGQAYAGAFSEHMKKAIGEAQREIRSTIKLTSDDKEVQRTLRGISNELNKLSKAKIGIDVEAADALATIEAVSARVKGLQKDSRKIDVGVNTAAAQIALERLEKTLDDMRKVNIEVEVDERKMGLFEKAVKRRLKAATENIAPVRFDADVSPALNKVQKLRHEMATLLDKRVGIDIDGSSLLAEMERIRAALASVGGDKTLDVQVRADAASAAKELIAIRALVELIDGTDVKVDVDVNGATRATTAMEELRKKMFGVDHQGRAAADSFRSFNAIILAGAALLAGLVPVLGAAAGALALMGPLALGAAAGLGVLIFGFTGIADAVKALGNQRESAVKDATTAARTMRDASASVADAERGVADAREQAGKASAAAARNVRDAVQNQKDAEQDLVRAQGDVVRAQEAVNQAREDARERIEDLALSVRGGALAEREAVLDLRQAQKEYNEGLAGGTRGDDLERLKIDLEQAKLRVDQLRESNRDMSLEQAEFARTGIEGSREVKDAQQGVADAQQGVADAMSRVADASQGVQDALAAQAQTNADNSRTIQNAQRSLTDAQQRYTDALYDTGSAGSAAAQATAEAFEKLGPAGKTFALFIDGLRTNMRTLRDEVQAGLLPGVAASIDQILRVNGPLLQTFMRNMGNTLGNLFREFGDLMTSPQWQGIWATFNQYAPTFVEQFAHVGMAMLTFFGELFQGLAPYAERFGDSLVNLANKSAEWVAVFVHSDTFKDFMEWLFTEGPIVFGHLVDIAKAIFNIVVALEPLGQVVLGMVGAIADWINAMDPQTLGIILSIVLGLVVAFQAASGAAALLAGAFTVMGTPLARAVFLFGAIASAFLIFYTQLEGFREFIDSIPGPIKILVAALGALVFFRGPLSGLFSTLRGQVSTLGTALGVAAINSQEAGRNISTAWRDAATQFRYATGGATDAASRIGAQFAGLSSVVGTAFGGMQKAAGSLVGYLGGAWGVGMLAATVLIGEITSTIQKATEQEDKWAEALRGGGQAAADVQEMYQRSRNERTGFEWMKDLDEWTGAASSLADVREEVRRLWNEMTPLEQAQAKVSEWTETLAYRQQTLGSTSRDTQIAHERLSYWTDILSDRQRRLDQATTNANLALLDQQNQALAMADADIAFSQSTDQLAQAQQRAADALKTNGANSREYQEALAAVETQSLATARAAARVAEERYANLDDAEREQFANAALLVNLQEQEKLYGKLPPRLQQLKADLEATVPAAYVSTVQMDNLGLAVLRIPDDKRIVISGDTPAEQLQILEDLGFKVTHLEDGSFEVTANTGPAQDILDNFINTERSLDITAGITWAAGDARRSRENRDFQDSMGINGPFQRAGGGPIYGPGGPTSDVIPAWLSNGEYVIRAASVQKYGLGLLDMINAGQYAMGGLVKNGRRKFQSGGLAATWGGTMNLTGGDTNPLAQVWFDAIRAINAAAATGAALISAHFGRMRDAALGTIRDLRGRAIREWTPFVLFLVNSMNTTKLTMGRTFGQFATDMLTRFKDLRVRGTTDWSTFMLRLMTTSVTTRTAIRTQFNTLALEVTTAFVRMRTSVTTAVEQLVGAIGTHFARLPRLTATPVNSVIDRVLNRGLFRAFNQIVLELGLSKDWVIGAAPGVQLAATGGGNRLAAGGRVPGYSPNDQADNIPAWLTAGEWVQPVSAVKYYGADLMEKIRRRQIPREQLALYADGGSVQRRATGGEIFAKTLSAFPRAKLNSAYRPGDPGYHGRNMAADMGEAGFSGGIGRAYIAAMKRWWVDTFGRTASEIIYNGLGNDRTNIKNGAPYPYSTGTQAEHRNHLHVAYASALAGATGGPGKGVIVMGVAPPAWYSKYGSASGVLRVLQGSVSASDEIAAKYGKPGRMYDGLADKAVQYVWSKAKPQVESLFAGMAGSIAGAIATPSGASGPIVDIVRSVASKYGWSAGNEWNSLVQLINKESSFRNTAQNPTSTAYGLFQFLNSTWASVGGSKTSDPGLQTEYGLRYIKGRYGSPSQALAFHLSHNWYGEGGEVSEGSEAPTLYDTGGWLPPGITTVLNATNKPEPILTADQWRELTAARGGGDHGSAIRELHIHEVATNVEEAIGAVNHNLRVLSHGGRYAGVGGN